MDSSSVIKYQLRAFRTLGLLPSSVSNIWYKMWGWIIFGVAGLGLLSCQALSILYVQSINDLVKELLLFGTTCAAAMKIALFELRSRNMNNILEILQEMDQKADNHSDISTMNKVYKNCRRISAINACLYLGSLVILFVELFMEREERTWKSTALVPKDFAQQPNIYYSVLVFQIISNSLCCVICLAIDTNSLLIINFLCGHIAVLATRIKSLGTEKGRSKAKSNSLHLQELINHYGLLTECV